MTVSRCTHTTSTETHSLSDVGALRDMKAKVAGGSTRIVLFCMMELFRIAEHPGGQSNRAVQGG